MGLGILGDLGDAFATMFVNKDWVKNRDLQSAYDKAPFSWPARPIDNTGKQVEDGDQIMLACRYSTLPDFDPFMMVSGDAKHTDGFIGWDGAQGQETAKWYEVSGDAIWDRKKALVFTVRRAQNDNIVLETEINGRNCKLTDINEKASFEYYLNELCYSTAWNPTEGGYILRFESEKVRTVVGQDNGQIDTSGDKESQYFRIAVMKYTPPPASFSWEDRPKATDGTLIEEGDIVTMRVSTKGVRKDDVEWNIIRDTWGTGIHIKKDFNENERPLTWTVLRHAPSNSIQFRADYMNKGCILAASTNPEARDKIVIDPNPNPIENAHTGWAPTEGGYHLYLYTHQYSPIHGEGNLFTGGRAERPLVFQFCRVPN